MEKDGLCLANPNTCLSGEAAKKQPLSVLAVQYSVLYGHPPSQPTWGTG